MPATVKLMDTRGGQSMPMSSCPASVHGSGDLLVGGGTTYAVSGATGRGDADRRRPLDGGSGDEGHRQRYIESEGWNPRASMAFDSAKGLLNPVGENNCFLNSAVQVCQTSEQSADRHFENHYLFNL